MDDRAADDDRTPDGPPETAGHQPIAGLPTGAPTRLDPGTRPSARVHQLAGVQPIEGIAPAPPAPLHGSLLHAVHEAARLLRADGAILYLLDAGGETLRWAYDAGVSDTPQRVWMRSLVMPVGAGMFGVAVEQRSVRVTDDYLADHSFQHVWLADEVARGAGIRSMCVAPLIAGEEVLGALGVYVGRRGALGEQEASLVRALADHAAANVANARLIEQLARSREELARKAEQERTLREITGRLVALGEPGHVLQRIVDGSRRLLGADGAHLCLVTEGRHHLVPVVVAGGQDDATTAWLRTQEFPVGGGLNGLAAAQGRAVRTVDYLADPRIPHEPDDQAVAERLGLRGMAVAPLRIPREGVIGTLAISYRAPREVEQAAMDLLQGLADQAAIAVVNSRLYEELRRSEERYRYLLTNAPDIAWSVDLEGRFTFLSDAIEAITGWPTAELIGRRWSAVIHPDSIATLNEAWDQLSEPPHDPVSRRFTLVTREGLSVPADMRGVAMVADGVFMGAHGRVRDLREQVRLENDLANQAAELAAAGERARLARELHDSVTQALFSMTLTTRSIELLVDRDPEAARRMLHELRVLERDALAEMRALIFELRPGHLEELGLEQALRAHAEAVQGRTGVPITVDCPPLDRPPLAVEDVLYRVAQEAIHNVVKHAGAARIGVRVARSSDGLRLSVEDDGRGFDPAQVPPGHLGLAGMRSRAEGLGGEIIVESRPGAGTRVEVRVPVPPGS